jgi:hypothetical protein
MTWITDNPLPLLMLGFIGQVILGIILWQTGRGEALLAMIVLAVVSLALLIAELVIVSPTEEVTARLHEIAGVVATNDLNQILDCVVPEAIPLRSELSLRLRRVKIEEVWITAVPSISFETDVKTQRPTATAELIGRVKAKFLRDSSPYEQMAGRYRVDLRKEPDDKWRVMDYQMNRW